MRWRPRTAAVVTALLTLAGALVAGTTTSGTALTAQRDDAPSSAYGFTAGTQLLQLSPAALANQLDAVVAAGGTWIRVPFNWGIVEATKGAPDWSALDRVIAAADERRLHVLGVISYAPQWARTSTHATAPPDDPAAFGTFAGQVASRYAASVNTWEIWNEPNIKVGFGGTVDAAKYVALLKAAFAAIKKVQRGKASTVVSAGLNRGPDATGGLLSYVKQMYAAGAKGSFDALGLHPYLRATANTTYEQDARALLDEVAQIRRFMLSRFNPRRIWFTEFGRATSKGFTQTQQADVLMMQLDQYARLSYAGPSILYTIRDAGANAMNDGHNFGTLMTFTGQPKVLATRLQQRAAAASPTRTR